MLFEFDHIIEWKADYKHYQLTKILNGDLIISNQRFDLSKCRRSFFQLINNYPVVIAIYKNRTTIVKCERTWVSTSFPFDFICCNGKKLVMFDKNTKLFKIYENDKMYGYRHTTVVYNNIVLGFELKSKGITVLVYRRPPMSCRKSFKNIQYVFCTSTQFLISSNQKCISLYYDTGQLSEQLYPELLLKKFPENSMFYNIQNYTIVFDKKARAFGHLDWSKAWALIPKIKQKLLFLLWILKYEQGGRPLGYYLPKRLFVEKLFILIMDNFINCI